MWDIRTITPDEVDLFRSRLSRGFGQDPDDDESERFSAVVDPDRMFAVFDGDDMVGTGGAFSLNVTVPGGVTVPMGGTTMVTVQSTHRRRGILTELMSRHLDEVAGNQEPIAGLWASESGIYGRFGYGPAAFRHHIQVQAGKIEIAERSQTGGTVRLIDPDEAKATLPNVFETARVQRPGMFVRTMPWWQARILADHASQRRGKSALRFLVHEVDGRVDGYAIYRQKSKWDDFVADGEVEVDEVITTDAAAHSAIWSFLVNVDLFPRLNWWNAPVDDPLSLIVNDSRQVRRTLSDSLWIRLVDVPAALAARGYEYDGTLVMRLHDQSRLESAGTFRLETIDGKGSCERVDEEADLELDAQALGHLYLGAGNARALAWAGRIEGDSESVTMLHRMFRTDLAAWCPEIF